MVAFKVGDAKGFWAECHHCGFKAWADEDGRITSHRDDRKQNPTWCAGIGKKAVIKWRSSINKASDATAPRHSARDRSAASDALGTALRSYAKDGRATDDAASYGFATLLAVLLAWYRAQHLPPQDYNLETYQPARKTF